MAFRNSKDMKEDTPEKKAEAESGEKRPPADFAIGQMVMHPLYGIGMVEKIEEKDILGKVNRFSVISFQNDRLKIMVNMEQKNNLIRNLISKEEIPKVLEFIKGCKSELPTKSSERYNVNLKKIKSSDIFQLAEVIKDLSALSREKKLSPKEMNMLKQSRKMLSMEFGYVSNISLEDAEMMVEASCKADLD
jgi:CarD family transcriptional regulator